MSQQKTKKSSPWFQCEKCAAYLLNKDIDSHDGFCPPNTENIHHPYIHESSLYGILDVKPTEDIKNLSSREKDGLVFVSQAVMQLCGFSIGENVIVCSVKEKMSPLVQKIWPTNEKTLTSVLFTKNMLEVTGYVPYDIVVVKKLTTTSRKAVQVSVVVLNGPKSLEITSELNNRLSKSYLDRYLTEGNVISIMYYGTILKLEIKLIQDDLSVESKMNELSICALDKFYLIDHSTKWKIYRTQELFSEENKNETVQPVSGLDSEISVITEMMNAGLGKVKFSGTIQSKSVLLFGNSGTGKTSLAKMLAKGSKAHVVEIYPTDLYSKHAGNPEEVIKDMFQKAIDHSPSVIILDEIDTLCPTRNGRLTETEKRIVSTILICLDEISSKSKLKIFIIATTNKIESIEPALRRCGRLDIEMEIPIPSPGSRKLILHQLLSNTDCHLTDADFLEVARTTHGFVGADLVTLCSQASLLCTRRNGTALELEDFKLSLRDFKPSAMREVKIEVPNVKWSDIGGQDKLKLILRQAVEWPLKHADSFTRLGITPPRGVLMYGPPGCSKTMIAKALATESGLNFLSIKGPELFNKWVGESERAVREVFRKARQVAPSIVFFDEIDALGGERSSGSSTSVQERVLTQLLTELDGVTPLGDVAILAATNRPDRIDKALLRPGRLDRIVYVPLPDESTRRDIFRIQLSKMPTKNVILDELVERTKGYSGAEVNAVCHEAGMIAMEENLDIEHVESKHFERALLLVQPRTPQSLISLYEEYAKIKI